jgi:hypothetical protein
MKQKDIALILIIVVVSGMMSFFVSRWLFVSPKDRQMKAEVVDAISTDFQQPNPSYFNPQSINPTQLVRIGDSANVSPFSGR